MRSEGVVHLLQECLGNWQWLLAPSAEVAQPPSSLDRRPSRGEFVWLTFSEERYAWELGNLLDRDRQRNTSCRGLHRPVQRREGHKIRVIHLQTTVEGASWVRLRGHQTSQMASWRSYDERGAFIAPSDLIRFCPLRLQEQCGAACAPQVQYRRTRAHMEANGHSHHLTIKVRILGGLRATLN